MGNRYVNFTVHASRRRVVEVLRAARRTAFVSTTLDGYTVLFDQKCEDQDADQIRGLGNWISAILSCAVLAVLNQDDVVLRFWLYYEGKLAESYDSAPDHPGDRELTETEVANLVDTSRARTAELRLFCGCEDDLEDREQGESPEGAGTILCRILKNARAIPRVQKILASTTYAFAVVRHQDLVDALGLPTCGVGAGYDNIADGHGPDDLDDDAFLHLG